MAGGGAGDLEGIIHLAASVENPVDDHHRITEVEGDSDAPLEADGPQAEPNLVPLRPALREIREG